MIGRDPVYPLRKKLLLNILKSMPKGRILDIGSNNGDTCNEMNQLGFNVVGIDNNLELIEKSKKSYPDIKFVFGDLEKKFPFENSYFDIIWAGDIIEHLVNTKKFLEETNRVLKKDGFLILSTPYHGIIKNISIAIVDFDEHYHPEHEHVRFYTKKTLKNQLAENGFKIKKLFLLGRIKLLAKNMFAIAEKVN